MKKFLKQYRESVIRGLQIYIDLLSVAIAFYGIILVVMILRLIIGI